MTNIPYLPDPQEAQANTKFWIVCKNSADLTASKRHYTYQAAEAEAIRLCKKTAADFFILESIAVIEPQEPPVSVTLLAAVQPSEDSNPDYSPRTGQALRPPVRASLAPALL
jgi:hypothetical protein